MKNSKTERIIFTAGSILLLLVAVIPLLYIAQYSHPCADDYTYGNLTHAAWMETHSIFATVKQAINQVKNSYNTWQGTFSSIFLMSLSPAVFEDTISYGMSALIMLSMLILSVFSITYSIFVKIVKTEKYKWLFVASITSFLMIESMHSPVNGLYWFNGSVHYAFMHANMLLMLTCILNYCIEKREKNRTSVKPIYIILASLLTVVCGGANYSTALLGICLLTLLLLSDCILCKKFSIIAIPFVTYVIAFLMSIIAPGNSVRSSRFEGMGPISAIIEAVKLTAKDDLYWSDLQLVIILIMLVPILYSISKSVTKKIKWWIPIITVILSFGLHAVLNVPLFFAMGGGAVARQENICKFWFQLMVVLNTFLIICVIKPFIDTMIKKITGRLTKLGKPSGKTVIIIVFYSLMAIVILIHVKTSPKCIYQYSSYVAYSQYRSGEIIEYDNTYNDRLAILESEETDVILPAYTAHPYLLYFDDITGEASDWRNTAFAKWYEKNSVIAQ